MPAPVSGPITQGFGGSGATVGSWTETFNEGYDFGVPVGTPVRAVRAGTVENAGDAGDGWGTSVKIRDSEGRLHNYGHLSTTGVRVGDYVGGGAWVGNSGNTGLSTGPHLSYDVYDPSAGSYIDPSGFVNAESWDEGMTQNYGRTGGRSVPPPNAADYWIQERDDNGNPVGQPYFDYELFAGDMEAYEYLAGTDPAGLSPEERRLYEAQAANYYSQIENRAAENALGYGNLEARYAELGGTNQRFYSDLEENARQFGLTFGEDVRQFDLTLGEDIRQFDITEGRLMRAQEFEERATRAQTMIDELDMAIRAGELTLSEATAQFNRRFNTADLQRQIVSDLAPITVPRGSEYLPGFEAGGPVAALYEMGGATYTPTKIRPMGVDPTVIAQNILDQTALPFEAASRAVVTPGQVQAGFGNALAQLGMV